METFQGPPLPSSVLPSGIARDHRPEVVPVRRDLQSRSAAHYLDDGPVSARLQTTVALVARTLGFPIAMINILDETTRHTINLIGTCGPMVSPRQQALCDEVVTSGQVLVLPDTGEDSRFADLPMVARREVGAYVGVPLTGRESFVVGTLCLVDPRPRTIDADITSRLVEFGKIIEDQLDLLRRLEEQRVDGEVAVAELATAIADEQILPWYQPMIDLSTGRTVGFEALARWPHRSGAMHDPRQFIPLAEDSDLILDLDLLILRRTIRDLREWQRIDPNLHASVNFSSRHFGLKDSAAGIVAAVLDAGGSPESLILEVTETSRLNPYQAAQVLHDLRDAGFQVWLDDFGTGWSALDYLLRLPVTGLKIDRAVTVALGSRLGNALTRAVSGLATELNLLTTVEGIESPAQAALAQELGCTYAQGYLWSRPVPAAAITGSLLPGIGTLPQPRVRLAESVNTHIEHSI